MKSVLTRDIDRAVNLILTAVVASTAIKLSDRQGVEFLKHLGGGGNPFFKFQTRAHQLDYIAGEFVLAVLGRHVAKQTFTPSEFEEFSERAEALGYRFQAGLPPWEVTICALPVAARRGVPNYLSGLRQGYARSVKAANVAVTDHTGAGA